LFKDVPVIDRWDYDEFILTGGEPLMFSNQLVGLLNFIRNSNTYMGISSKFYLYTSVINPDLWDSFIWALDGITYTVHTKDNAAELVRFIYVLRNYAAGYDTFLPNLSSIKSKSIWLNLFPESKKFIEEELSKSPFKWDDISEYFKIRPMEWKDNCPIPEGEDFRRINNPW
jgi:MoaA/NifB/PqqE/SkfB family radical SAM enzyme